VYRVTFRFRDPFWEDRRELQRAGFFFSHDPHFFTWWTSHPMQAPLLTGWMAGSAADRFAAPASETVVAEALASLARILGRKIPRPEAVYFHNWQADSFFRGAYSYVPVNATRARETLAKPVSGTLFFAGEAADVEGHGATVHGAMASGRRSARLLLQSLTNM